MSLNPPSNPDKIPKRYKGEDFVLFKQGVNFEIDLGKDQKGKKLQLKGSDKIMLSTKRLVLINNKN